MHTVSQNSWHWRVYSHWRRRIADSAEPKTLDLCRYMRTVLIYVPGFYLLAGIVVFVVGVFLLATVIVWGPIWLLARKTRFWQWLGDKFTRFGKFIERKCARWAPYALYVGVGALVLLGLFISSRDHWWLPLVIIGGAVLTVALLLGAMFAGEKYIGYRKEKRRLNPKPPKPEPEPKAEKPPREPSVLWAWIKAKKRKVCPLITVKEDAETGGAL